jgi:hypothetical protein
MLLSNYATGNSWSFGGTEFSTGQQANPAQNGAYTLTVTQDGCTASTEFVVNNVGLTEQEIAQYVQFDGNVVHIAIDWSLYDLGGRLVRAGTPGIIEVPNGMYLVVTELFTIKLQK